MSTTIDTDRFRQLLDEERQRVVDAIENIHAENPGSMADETEEVGHDTTSATSRPPPSTARWRARSRTTRPTSSRRSTPRSARIEDGTFGTCERCGQPIGAERLEALPWATLCIEDKRKQERG